MNFKSTALYSLILTAFSSTSAFAITLAPTSVPEPSVLALLAVGGIAAVVASRKNSK
jgi:hypothetical protein